MQNVTSLSQGKALDGTGGRELRLEQLHQKRFAGLSALREKRARVEELERERRAHALQIKMLVMDKIPATVPTHNLQVLPRRVGARVRYVLDGEANNATNSQRVQ